MKNLTVFDIVQQVIRPEELAFCGNDCLVLYTVYLQNQLQPSEMGSFVLQAVSDVLDLNSQSMNVVYGTVGYRAYRYYRIHLEKNHSLLNFKLQVLSDGDARLIVAHDQPPDFRPSFSQQVLCPHVNLFLPFRIYILSLFFF